MSRRRFLHLAPLALGSVLGCGSAPLAVHNAAAPQNAAAPRQKIRGICFDLFTLFDPRSVVTKARAIAGDDAVELCEAWRQRQFQYAFLRAAAGQYQDFRRCTEDALVFAAKSRKLSIAASDRESLVNAYSELEPWPDTRERLETFRAMGLKLAPLANYAPGMLTALIEHAKLTPLFDDLISTDAAHTFKPAPAAYALGPTRLGLPREALVFAAFGGWDAAGAKWFGYPTFWVNRLGVPAEELAAADDSGPTLQELTRFVETWV